jgi:hypothetical protein
MKHRFAVSCCLPVRVAAASAQTCLSSVTLQIQSSNYSEPTSIEPHEDSPPGSKVFYSGTVETTGQRHSDPVLTVTYFRTLDSSAQKVGSTCRQDL